MTFSSKTLRRFAFGLYLVCEMCSVLNPNGLLGNSVGQWQDRAATFPTAFRQRSLDFVGTLFAHLRTHNIAKLAIRRPGLADAGSASQPSQSQLHAGF